MIDEVRLSSVAAEAVRKLESRARQEEYLTNPALWAQDHLGVKLWSKQVQVAQSVVENRNTVVKAGHEVGKSWLAGLLICWWIDVHWKLPGGVFVVSTAPGTRQINAIVWREVRKFHQLSKRRFAEGLTDHELPGYITADAHWRLPDGIELGYGAKPPDSKDDTMSGIHARYVLAVGDEAVGLPQSLIGDLGNITSNATSRRLLICNPTNPLSYVASIFRRALKSWATFTISVFDSPNFTDEKKDFPPEALESFVDQSYVDDIMDDCGENYELHPTYIARVLGEFAWDMGFTIIRPEDVAKGIDAEIEPSLETLPRLGVDVSRSKAGDQNTIYSWHDGKLRYVDSWNEANAVNTANRIHDWALKLAVKELRIDGSGLGGPIADYVRQLAGQRYQVLEMIGSDRSPDPVRWFNCRAWWYWSFQDRLSKGQIDLDLEDEVLQRELLGVELKKRTAGTDSILLESKEEMRKRGFGSPDHADAAIYAAADLDWLTDNPLAQLRKGDKVVFDPDEVPEWQFAAVGSAEPW